LRDAWGDERASGGAASAGAVIVRCVRRLYCKCAATHIEQIELSLPVAEQAMHSCPAANAFYLMARVSTLLALGIAEDRSRIDLHNYAL
jgi:hypothetical protein